MAIVGGKDSSEVDALSQNIADYFFALKKLQRNTAAWLVVPGYQTRYFET